MPAVSEFSLKPCKNVKGHNIEHILIFTELWHLLDVNSVAGHGAVLAVLLLDLSLNINLSNHSIPGHQAFRPPSPSYIISYHIIIGFLIKRAGTGAASTPVGLLPDSWLAARMADLTLDLQVCRS